MKENFIGKTMLNGGSAKFIIDIIQENFYEGIASVGITGRAGAGKTTFSNEMVNECTIRGLPHTSYNVDWNFLKTSEERAKWIGEAFEIGIPEYINRANQLSWWDFDKVAKYISLIKKGETVVFEDAYDKRSGKKDLRVQVGLPENKGILLVENCFIADPIISKNLDIVVYLLVDQMVGFQRVYDRDKHRKSFNQLFQRYAETTWSEDQYMMKHFDSIEDRLMVIDNNHPNEKVLLKLPGSKLDEELRMRIAPAFDSLVVPVKYLNEGKHYAGS